LKFDYVDTAVVMPVYNGEDFLEDQLNSILNQTYQDFKLYIYDDLSTDNSRLIIERYREQDKRIFLITNRYRKGVIKNINDALNEVNAEYYFLADQDDIWVGDKLKVQMKILQDTETIMTFSNLELIDRDGMSIGKDFWKTMKINPVDANKPEIIALKSIVTGCTMGFKKKLLIKALPINESAIMHDHWLSFFAASYKVKPIYDKLVLYRQHQKNLIGIEFGIKNIGFSRYKNCLSINDIVEKKISEMENTSIYLKMFWEKMNNSRYKKIINYYFDFYQNLTNKNWYKSFLLILKTKNIKMINYLNKVFLVWFFFDIIKYLIFLKLKIVKLKHNS